MPAKNYASTRFSGLDEIHTAKCRTARRFVDVLDRHGLGSRSRAARRRQHDVHRHAVSEHRLRARSEQARRADEMADTTRSRSARRKGVACCDVVNRGAAYADGAVFFNTLDGRTIALDAATGRPKWITKLGDINKGETITMAPLVVKGKVLVGNSGGEFGVRGWLTALDAGTGADRVARLQHGPGQGRADRAELQAVSTTATAAPTSASHVARRGVEDRRRHRVGLDLVRSRARPDLLRHRQSRSVESGAASRRQQVDGRASSRASPTPAKRAGSTRPARTTCTTTTASTSWCSSICRSAGRRARWCCAPTATACSTCIDRTTRRGAVGRRRSATSTRTAASTCRRGG